MALRVTLRMIAKEAKRDLATVSMALRNDPRLKQSTIEEIRAIAKKMGYVQDLAVSAVMSRLRTSARSQNAEVLAYLHARPLHEGHEGTPDGSDPFYIGATAEAARQGYKLDAFNLSTPTMTPRRISSVLRHRGIRGVIIAPFPAGESGFDFEWANFSAVALGASLHSPVINRVTNGQYTSLHLAMEKLILRGYKRIGFAINSVHNKRLHGAFLGAYLACQQDIPPQNRLAPLVSDELTPEMVLAWISRESPDVIISSRIWDMLEDGTLPRGELPPDIAFAGTDVSPHGTLSGIFQNHEHDGAESVRMLIGQLLRNEYGIPQMPMTYTTFGTWYEGKTTPRDLKN